ncbi:MAG: hypothetical protein AAGF95_04510 [Chloroflexota bacterium]
MGRFYRLYQLLRAITGRVSQQEWDLVAQQLTECELVLFKRMASFDQRHCIDVYTTLVRHGYQDPTLLRASLLHDCGKVDDNGRPIPLVYYGIFVVLQRFMPKLYTFAASKGHGIWSPFAIHDTHELRSVQLVQVAGGSSDIVSLLQDYADHRQTPQTYALQWADNQN